MRIPILLLVICINPAMAATTTNTGDLWITDKLGVGTTSPSARVEVKAEESTENVFRVSGVDLTPFVYVDKKGNVGFSTFPTANLDISGVADAADVGLQLGAGNLYPGTTSYQITFGYAGLAQYRHAIRSIHADSVEDNKLDFLIWTPSAGASTDFPDMVVMSLQTSTGTNTGGAMHIRPVGRPQVSLVVSNGTTYAGGDIHRNSASQPSSRAIKSDIVPMGNTDQRQAYEEIRGLHHVSFRYKGMKNVQRGLIYEEAPASIHGSGKSLSLDYRLLNSELAVQELMSRMKSLESDLEVLKNEK